MRRPSHYVIAQHGFSLVELMVAMSLSLLLLAGVVAIFGSSRASYETTDRLSRIQENGRFALDQIVSDIRTAGFPGCARVPTNRGSVLNSATDIKWNFLDAPIRGFQYTGPATYSPAITVSSGGDAPSAADNSDILVIRRPERDAIPLRLTTDMLTTIENLAVANVANSGLDAGDIAQISSCEATMYFQVTSFAGGVITHTATGSPGNGTTDLGFLFRTNAEILPVETAVYYIRASTSGPAGSTSLWRRVGTAAPVELVEGIEQMQLRFGVDTNGDSVVDNDYQLASAVANWDNVRSVEVALLVRSTDGYGGDLDAQTYQLLDTTVAAPNDNRMREVFTASVSLRNRVLVN